MSTAIFVPSLMLIAQVVFLLDCGHTNRDKTDIATDATDHPTMNTSATDSVGTKTLITKAGYYLNEQHNFIPGRLYRAQVSLYVMSIDIFNISVGVSECCC